MNIISRLVIRNDYSLKLA